MKSMGYAALMFCCAWASLSPGYAAEALSPFQLSDLRKVVSLSSPRVARDGKRIAVVVSTPDWDTDEVQQHIDLVDTATGARRELASKRKGLSMPRWSPDGTRLAFLAEDADTGKEQIFAIPVDGGDALRISEATEGVAAYSWSPDGTRIAFIAQDEAPKPKSGKQQDDAFQVTDNNFLMRVALAPWHLWVVPSTGGKATRLTQDDYSLSTDLRDSTPEPAWSPDGRHVVFTRFTDAYWAPSFKSVIADVAADAGQPQVMLPEEGSINPAYAARGDALAFMRPRNGDTNNGNAVYVSNQGVVRDATQALARNFNAFVWMPDNALLLAGVDGTQWALWRQPLSGAAKKLDLGDVQAHPDISVSRNGVVAFVGSTANHPDELYVMDSVEAKPRRLTDLNAFVDALSLGRTESIAWRGPDGFQGDGVLTYPVGYIRGKTYPLVLVIHGGPADASSVAFLPLPQLLAAQGFVVFRPNYRGSTNLGDAYQHAIFRDTGAGPGTDVMAGLAAVEKLGMVDEQHIGVSGWSYGGYMTTWLTGHYPIWKAAVAGAALTDWIANYAGTYYPNNTHFFGGSPWTAKYHDIWREQSPIAYAQNVTAPTLIMGDVGDPIIPLINSYEWYHALHENGVHVEFYAYPVNTHFPNDIVRTTDVYRRWVDWMTRYLK